MNTNQEVMAVKEMKQDRNTFIRSHYDFVLGKVSKVTKKYVQRASDEEFVIGLEAFNEAIDRFDVEKGNFLPFADQVIRSRLLDWLRKEQKDKARKTSLQGYEVADWQDLEYGVVLKQEVFDLKQKLAQFDITFDDLVVEGPKKTMTRRKMTEVGRKSARDKSIVEKLYATCKLPMKAISGLTNVTLRIVKTHRKFIITVIVVIKEGFESVGEFLLPMEER